MKRRIQPILLPIFLLGSLAAGELELGSSIPMANVKMPDVSNEEISLNDAMGPNGLLVVFSCNTCPWVDAWEDRYIAIAEKYASRGIGMIAVNPNEASRERGDSFEDMQDRAGELGYTFYYALDEDSRLANAFGATRTPHIFLFDNERKLIYRGAIDDNERKARKVKKPYLMNAMDEMLAGKPVTLTSTKALGCTIKFGQE